MKIGILEIMPTGHYTLVDSVARIYASDKGNHIYICIREDGEKNLQPLKDLYKDQITIMLWNPSTSLKLFFNEIDKIGLDKLYVVTLEKYFKDFFLFDFNCQIKVFIHNIDEWFDKRFRYLFYHLFSNSIDINALIYSLKKNIYYNYYKRRIKKKILINEGKFVVLNSTMKNELHSFVPENYIEIIPFSVYNHQLKCETENKKILRICIPGIVSELRRDYYLVSKIFFDNLDKFIGKVEIVLLGFVSDKEFGFRIIDEFKRLNEHGIKVKYFSKEYIPLELYDFELSQSDIVLGNMKLSIDKYSSYGKTKETGIPFTMIRAAIPGILPRGYPTFKGLESSTLLYSDSHSLLEIFIELISNSSYLSKLKEKAKLNALKFAPSELYKELIQNDY